MLGRVMLGGLFVYGGVRHFFIVPILTDVLARRGVPFPRLTLLAGSTFQTIVGAMLIVGIFIVPAAFGLIAFTIVASIMLLNFWDMQGGEREAAKNNWAVNVGVIGGLLLAATQAM